MCGLVGAVGRQRNLVPVLLEGLKQLEYRGYDSAGVAALVEDRSLYTKRVVGKVGELESSLVRSPVSSSVGIAHTRWATHGAPEEINAHPQVSNGTVAVVHNGIIENHEALRKQLEGRGYRFVSDTDTEVIAHCIYAELQDGKGLRPAVHAACRQLEGSYALAVLSPAENDRMVVARRGSPLLLGMGEEEYLAASDMAALLPVTRTFISLKDGDVAELSRTGTWIFNEDEQAVDRQREYSDLDASAVEKNGYRHFMRKEIFEQGRALRETLTARVANRQVLASALGRNAERMLQQMSHVHLVACGTSYHAGLVAGHTIEMLAGIPCAVELASEFRYRRPVVPENSLFVTLSQSGETADTLAALRFAQQAGYRASLAICNVPGSSLVRESDLALMTHAGPEIGVASTKAFTTQLMAMAQLAILLARANGLNGDREKEYVDELKRACELVEQVLGLDHEIATLSRQFRHSRHALFLGRGAMYPVAMEGALKLKEISYIHAEAYAAGELKHGPLALVDKHMPVVAIAPDNALLGKLKSNLQEVRARGGALYVFADAESDMEPEPGTTVITLPSAGDVTAPLIYAVPLQLLAYHVAVLKGTDVDKPRNLAKSVTVE